MSDAEEHGQPDETSVAPEGGDVEDSDDGPFGEGGDGGRRRVRRRRHGASPADMPVHAPAPGTDSTDHFAGTRPSGNPGPPAAGKPAGKPAEKTVDKVADRSERPEKVDKVERGLRGLVGAGPSQVPVSAAMRARDAARPTEDDLAAAAELPIVRRNYVPPDDSPR